jgi:YD repeat-containing protein
LSHQRGSTLLAGFTYTLDSVGNRLSKTQSGLLARTETYAYDAVDQLLSAQYAGVGLVRTVSYQYDAAGNLQWRNDAGTTTNYAVNPDNAYTQVGGAPASLDANGNHAGTAGATYTYDAQNRLTSATVNATTTTFTYDARNRVIQRTVVSGSSTSTTYLIYSQWHLIEERNGTGDLAQVYVHGAAMDELLVKFTPERAVYYHHDGLGSTIALTDETGQLLESYIYDAFGAASVVDSSFILTKQPLSLHRARMARRSQPLRLPQPSLQPRPRPLPPNRSHPVLGRRC